MSADDLDHCIGESAYTSCIGAVSFTVIREKLHSRNLPDVVHVRLRSSPMHTGATPEGDRVTTTMHKIHSTEKYSHSIRILGTYHHL